MAWLRGFPRSGRVGSDLAKVGMAGLSSNLFSTMTTTSAFKLLSDLMTDLCQMQIQLSAWLPSFAERARHRGLKHLIGKHRTETVAHLEKLAGFFDRNQVTAAEGAFKPMSVIIDQVDRSLAGERDPEAQDLLMLIHFLRIEQFEITSYEIVARVADQLGYAAETELLIDFLAERDASAAILRELKIEMLQLAFPTETKPKPIFPNDGE